MRRPRSKLQVSMFPFLAVLLCVMGALLLILFVMDRRAKLVAQHKVSEIKSERLARSKADEEARKAEWEKAKAALHQSLLAQQNQLTTEAKDLDGNLNDANKNLDLVKNKEVDLQKKIASEAEKIALLQVQLVNQQNGVKETAKKENVSRADLLEAAKELADLELAFKKLRTLKNNDKQTYSLVPYRGKHGDLRPPIYVECVGAGVLFHPEKELLTGPYFTTTRVRSEVERRAGPLLIEKAPSKDRMQPPAEARTGAYVLFLVRPDGIENYYQAQSALKGYQIDFGYELVDQHWALDFGPLSKGMPAPQLAKANLPPPLAPMLPPTSIGSKNGNGGNGGTLGSAPVGPPSSMPPGSGTGNGAGTFGAGVNINLSPSTIGKRATNGGNNGNGGSLGNAPIGPPISMPPNFGAGNQGTSIGPSVGSIAPPIGMHPGGRGVGNTLLPNNTSPLGVAPGLGQTSAPGVDPTPGNAGQSLSIPSRAIERPAGTPLIGSAPRIGNPPYAGINASNPVANPSFVPIAKIAAPVPIATTGDGTSIGSRAAIAIPGNPQTPGAPSAEPIATTEQPQTFDKNAAPLDTERQTDGKPINAPYAGEQGGTSPSAGNADSGATQEPAPPFRPLPTYGADPKKKTVSPPPIGRVLGNKDFVITIDCYREHVSVFPSGMTFRWTAVNMKTTDQALVQGIKNLITKRQASVRPGEPPYRPIIRFRVSTEGLRTYYQAYPLLEPLGVAMRRENVND